MLTPPRRAHAHRPAALLVALLLGLPATAAATSLPTRTFRASTTVDGTSPGGASRNPVVSASGRVVAFETTASNIAGPDDNLDQQDIVAIDLATNERRLVSSPPGSLIGANGPSFSPVMSANGQRIAFASFASNLTAGDTNGMSDVFVRQGRDPLQLVSVGFGGVPASGPSYDPDISADGTRVVFVSEADNLVAGDANKQADVFVADLRTGVISLISKNNGDGPVNGRSALPAISANGRYVTFTSGGSNIVEKDTNGVTDVFLRDLQRELTERVSVGNTGRQQRRSVAPPFLQVSDISDDGRYVAFDSDADNLTANDTNRHTDVFLRDRDRRTTELVSASSFNVQGNNDSFAPRLSADGRLLTFESFATNLAAGDVPREDIFMRNLRQGTTSVVNVTASGLPRGPEQVPQLLQRPALSNDGNVAAFSSTSTNLVDGDGNAVEDVFIRRTDAPLGTLVSKPRVERWGRVRVKADDPKAKTFVCRYDSKPAFRCGASIQVPRGAGRRLFVRAGGPGMQFDADPISVLLTRDRKPPTLRVRRLPRANLRVIRGTASDRNGVAKVEVGFVKGDRPFFCKALVTRARFHRRASRANCAKYTLFTARGRTRWSLRLPRRIHGYYGIFVRATDRIGNRTKVLGVGGFSS